MFPFNQYPYLNMNDLNLDFILKHFKDFITEIAKLNEWQETHEKEYQELLAAWEAFEAGNWSPELENTMTKWISKNISDILELLIVNTVFFEITDSGNFIVYIPEAWSDITFHTTGYDYMTPLQPHYGHLVLSY